MTTQTLWIVIAIVAAIVLVAVAVGLVLRRRRQISLRQADELERDAGPTRAPPRRGGTYQAESGFNFSAGSGGAAGGTATPTRPGHGDTTLPDATPAPATPPPAAPPPAEAPTPSAPGDTAPADAPTGVTPPGDTAPADGPPATATSPAPDTADTAPAATPPADPTSRPADPASRPADPTSRPADPASRPADPTTPPADTAAPTADATMPAADPAAPETPRTDTAPTAPPADAAETAAPAAPPTGTPAPTASPADTAPPTAPRADTAAPTTPPAPPTPDRATAAPSAPRVDTAAPTQGAAPATPRTDSAPPPPGEPIAPPGGRLERLRGRLARTRSGFGQGLLGLLGAGELDEESWEDVEATLLQADLGPEMTAELVERLRTELAVRAVRTPEQAKQLLREVLTDALRSDLDRAVRALPHDGRPAVLLVVGVNGTGKTTTTGKLARVLVGSGHRVVLGAADTFRAAAAEQLGTWGERAGATVVRGAEGADPASVAFDAVKQGTAEGADAVLLDTAGRLHTKTGLMDELQKVKRVVERQAEVDEVLLVLDATTGQNGLTQARVFGEVVTVTGIVLTKLDGTAKGGIVFRVQRELGVPVKLVGLGEGPDDLAPFEPAAYVDALLT